MSKYIDADKAIKEIIAERDDGSLDGEYKDGFIDGMSTAAKILDELSAADVAEIRHGRWVEHIINNIYCDGGVAIGLTCPVCGECFAVTREARPRERFCRWCGAKMDEVEE